MNRNEFDLDIVVHIKKIYSAYTPNEIYNSLIKVLEQDERYRSKIEKKNRCVRLNYAGDFHLDILPGCIAFLNNDKNIKVPDRELRDWVSSNPKGYSEFFLNKANLVKQPKLKGFYNRLIELKAEIKDLPEEEFYLKTPLQRAVQLCKRCRDIYFEKNSEYATSSIVLTTLLLNFYNGEDSIYDTVLNVLNRIKVAYDDSIAQNKRFKIINPVNADEDFADSWTKNHFDRFFKFINDFHKSWEKLNESFSRGESDFLKLFGEGVYKTALRDQISLMGRYSKDPITIANSIILAGHAHTDPKGQINQNKGYRNEVHHNYGEK